MACNTRISKSSTSKRGLLEMLTRSEIDQIRKLHEEKIPLREIARQLQHSKNTIKKWVRRDDYHVKSVGSEKKFLIDNQEKIMSLFLECECKCVPLQRRIKEDFGQKMHLRMLERFCKQKRKEVRQQKLEIHKRFETDPGQQLQIDFGEKPVIIDGIETKIHIFVAKLGYSRCIYAKAFFKENADAWLDGLESCFHYFKGIPFVVVSDNSACLVRDHSAPANQRFTEKYQYFCDYYGVKPMATAVRKPRSKGKVENAVGYVKNNALVGKKFDSLESVNIWLESWCMSSNKRKLDTFIPGPNTPQERFLIEKNSLRQITQCRIAQTALIQRIVSKDCLIRINNICYKLPQAFSGKDVQIIVGTSELTVSCPGENTIELDKAKSVYTPEQQRATSMIAITHDQETADQIYRQTALDNKYPQFNNCEFAVDLSKYDLIFNIYFESIQNGNK